jgi:hypothetical protein
MAAVVLVGVFGFTSCSFGLPQSVRIRGIEVDLGSKDFDLPYALDKFHDSLPENTSVSLYNPGDGVQHLLVRMSLEKTEAGMPEIAGLGDGSFGDPLSFNIQMPGLLSVDRPLVAIKNGFPCASFFSGGAPLNARVDTGHLIIKPTSSIPGLDLSAEDVSVYVEHYDEEYRPQKQDLEFLDHDTSTDEWKFNLGGVIFYEDSELFISGSLPNGTVTISPSIAAFSSITLTSATSVSTPITLMQFGVKGDLTPEDLADYIYNIIFYTIDIKFDLGRKVEGLKIEFFYKDDPQTGVELTDGPRFAQGTSSLADDFLIVTAEDVFLNIVDQSAGTQILYELKANAEPSGGKVTLEDVIPGEKVVITAIPQFPPVFRIKQAVVNPDEMPDGLDLNINIPDTSAGEDPINLAELLKAVDDFLPIENLNLSPSAFLYLNDDLPRNMKLKIEADMGDDAPVNLLPASGGAGFAPIDDDRGQVPVFSGNEYAGALPAPALSLDGDKLMALFQSKPESLLLAIEAKLANPTTIEFSAEAAANTIIIKPDILLDLPLEFKLRADPPTADYAVIKLTQPNESERTDLFGRSSAEDPLINIGGITPEEITLSFDYVNTLGVKVDLALVATDFDGHENFRKIIPIGSGGFGTCTLNIRSSELRFPFRAEFEALFPAYLEEGGSKYGVLKIVPGGIIRVSELRADVQFGLDLDLAEGM